MWIRTQNNRRLVRVRELQIKPCNKLRSQVYRIVGTYSRLSFLTKIELGRYHTMEEAQIILSDIQYHINTKNQKVYQMK